MELQLWVVAAVGTVVLSFEQNQQRGLPLPQPEAI
jgi:hypothetical protein